MRGEAIELGSAWDGCTNSKYDIVWWMHGIGSPKGIRQVSAWLCERAVAA